MKCLFYLGLGNMGSCHPVFLAPLFHLSLGFLTHLALDVSSEQPLGGAVPEAGGNGVLEVLVVVGSC